MDEIEKTKLLDLGINPYDNSFKLFPAWLNREIHFADGQTWTLTKIETLKHKCKDAIIDELVLHFKNDKGRTTTYKSFFGGSKHKPQPAAKVVELYFNQLKYEWLMNIETPLLDAAYEYLTKEVK